MSTFVLDEPLEGGFSYLGRTAPAEHVCYLDYDGVLQHEDVRRSAKRGTHLGPSASLDRTLFEWTHLLEGALAPYPSVKLVLSTSWVRVDGFSRAMKRLSPQLRARVIGATYHRRIHGEFSFTKAAFLEMPRGMQVWADVTRRKPRAWLALDDDDKGWPEWCRDSLVHCDGQLGLSKPETLAELEMKLAAMFGC